MQESEGKIVVGICDLIHQKPYHCGQEGALMTSQKVVKAVKLYNPDKHQG